MILRSSFYLACALPVVLSGRCIRRMLAQQEIANEMAETWRDYLRWTGLDLACAARVPARRVSDTSPTSLRDVTVKPTDGTPQVVHVARGSAPRAEGGTHAARETAIDH